MKPLDVIQLVLGILVGTCVLRPDLAVLPSPASKGNSWPIEVEVAMRNSENSKVVKVAHCRARRGGTITTIASMPLRAGAFVGRKMPFSESERRKSSQHPSRNPAIAIDRNEYKAKAAKEVETNAVMIATHHGCEVF